MFTQNIIRRAAKSRTHPVFTRTTPNFTFSPSIFIQPVVKGERFSSSFGFTPLVYTKRPFFSLLSPFGWLPPGYILHTHAHTLRKLLFSVLHRCNGRRRELSLAPSRFTFAGAVCYRHFHGRFGQMFRFSITCASKMLVFLCVLDFRQIAE